MTLVDSMGWIDHFTDQRGAGPFSTALKRPQQVIVPTVCMYEVYRKVLTERGKRAALRAAAAMRTGTVVPLDADLAIQAASLARAHKLPMADGIIYATARRWRAQLLTRDTHFRGLPGVRFLQSPSRA